MKGQSVTFECSDCGQEKPVAELSGFSRRLAGGGSATVALMHLTSRQIVCRDCAGQDVPIEKQVPEVFPSDRLERQRVERDWLNLNY